MKNRRKKKGGKCTIAWTRRQVLKAGLMGAAGLMLPIKFTTSKAIAQIPGGSLLPGSIPKYATPLLIPPAMPEAGKVKGKGGKGLDYYEIAMRQFQQQILPAGKPKTTVWGYGPKVVDKKKDPQIFNAPSLTIEAEYERPIRIKWVNELVDAHGNYLPHLLPVDPTLHWANPPQGVNPQVNGDGSRDSRPTFKTTPGPYTGPVPMVTHVHGAAGVQDDSDGYAEAWFLPAANNIPHGYASEGTWYSFFKNKAETNYETCWERGSATFQYPNSQRASTIWYHDHTLGMTRLNVYAGPAGFYIIRGGPAGDDAVCDSRTGKKAILPGPAPSKKDKGDKTYYEIPIAIQDRSFNTDGSLFYPNSREFFDNPTARELAANGDKAYIPFTDISPIWNPEFFGNCIMVNGNTWPFLNVEQRRYRFRFLNGCDARFLILDFSRIAGVQVWMIGNEGGFLAASVNMTAVNGNKILMSPAERTDVIVDFTNVPVGSYVLGNVGPDQPYGGGLPGVNFPVADPDTTGQVMQFRVVPRIKKDDTTPPQFLVLPAITPLVGGTARPLALLEETSTDYPDAPAETLLGTVAGNPNTGTGTWVSQMWSDPITENPKVGAMEVWEFYNATVDAHPMHIHEVLFQVVNRQAIIVDEMDNTFQVTGPTIPPEPWEKGFKDTVIALPGQVTRVRMQFKVAGQFVWHCHIVEHEDNEMMRPYRIGPVQPGQPT